MKFGIKLWSTNMDLIDQAVHLIDKKTFDYIELFMIPDSEITPFLIDVPYIIHIPHEKFGVNIGDVSKKEYNLQKINESIRWADKLNARYLILHAGHGSMKHAMELLYEVADDRLLIENMPKVGLNNEPMNGYSLAQIKELIQDSSRGLCLDFGHAVKAAVSLEVEYKDYIKEFLTLEPKVFHISDGMLNEEKDEHLNIDDGGYDLGYFLECVNESDSKLVTLETPREDQTSLKEDVFNIKKLGEIKF